MSLSQPVRSVRRLSLLIAGRLSLPIAARLWLFGAIVCTAGWICGPEQACSQDKPAGAQLSADEAELWRSFFQSGSKFGAASLKAARADHARLKSKRANDAWVDYALGVVLVRQGQIKEAEALFQKISGSAPKPHYPSRQARIWCQVNQNHKKDLAPAFQELDSLATELLKPESESGLTSDERQELAGWLGELLSAIDQALDKGKSHEQFLVKRTALEARFANDAVLTAALKAGGQQVQQRLADLTIKNAEADQRAAAAAEKKTQQQAEKIEKSQAAAEEKKAALKQTAAEIEKQFKENLAAVENELRGLSGELQSLNNQAASVLQQYQQASAQESSLLASKPKPGSAAAAELTNVSARKNGLRDQGIRISGDIASAQQRASVAFARRNALAQRYQALTGQIIKQDGNLSKLQTSLEKKNQALADKAGADPKTASQRGKPFRTYLDFEYDEERRRVLAAVGVPDAAR